MNSEIIDKAYYSSYRIITNKISFDDLLEEDFVSGGYTTLVYDPHKEITRDIIEDVIAYFVGEEKYELCAELKEELDKIIN